jgi:hypothetical protein
LINQIDAKTIRVDRAFGNLLLLVKTQGRPVKTTKKPPILIKDLAETVDIIGNKNFVYTVYSCDNSLRGSRQCSPTIRLRTSPGSCWL